MRCLTKDECHQARREHARRREWKRQFTCIRPLNDLPWFAQELVGSSVSFGQHCSWLMSFMTQTPLTPCEGRLLNSGASRHVPDRYHHGKLRTHLLCNKRTGGLTSAEEGVWLGDIE